MRVATHDGSFHADEVFAIAALSLLGEPLEVVRTRDPEAMAGCDLRVDIGFAHDPATGGFDHHQRGFDLRRENGVGFASFGLIWQHYGPRVCKGDEEAAGQVDQVLVQGIDANDTGQTLAQSLIDDVSAMTVSGVIGGINARWDEDLSDDQERARFDEALALATRIIEREAASALSYRRATRVVQSAIDGAADPRIVELAENVPWKRVVVPVAPEALYVIYPKRQGFGLEAVPAELGSFANRRDLPEPWAGLDGPELAELTGVQDALFCHSKRFLAVARSRAGIGELARQALATDA